MEGTQMGLDRSRIRADLSAGIGGDRIQDGVPAESEYRAHAFLKALPESEAEVAEILRYAHGNRLSVVPQGGGTKDAYGQSAAAADILLSTKGLSGVIEHSAGDLMVTVRAGTPLRELQETLRRTGQFLPLDVAWDDQSTIGGIIHANASGPLRAGYGSARDLLIASRIVYPDGGVIRTGAKVVKNVAGYDMNKLFIGSMGTLGVHTEFTFKIRPLPVGRLLLAVGGTSAGTLRKLLETVTDSHLEPCVLEWMNEAAAKRAGINTQGAALLIGFADVWPSVDEQARMTREMARELGAEVLGERRGAEEVEAALAEVRNLLPNANFFTDNTRSVVSVKLMGKLTDVQAMYEAAEAGAAESGVSLLFSAGAYVGLGRATAEAAGPLQDGTRQRLSAWIRSVQSDMSRIGVRTAVDFAPASVRNQISIWGEATADQKIMQGIKRTIDPHEILNPGRIMGGQ